MKKINHNCKCWGLMLCLLVWLPIKSLAQTEQFEMVVEKVDGTQLPFLITDNYPVLQYQYGGEDGVNTLEILTEKGTESVPCHEIKRLFTRVAENTGIRNLPLDGQSFDVFDIRGQKIRHNATSFDNLPKGVYIINGRKVIR